MGFETLHGGTPDQIWGALRAEVKPGRKRKTGVEEAAGCVLAADVCIEQPFPPFDRAILDGYAVRSSDCAGGAARLHQLGLIRAGDAPDAALEDGGCFRINSGAPIPSGADAVVMVEDGFEEEDGSVTFKKKPAVGEHVCKRGALAGPGDLLLRAGDRLTANALSALVAGGIIAVEAFARPRTALLTTGCELVEHGRPLRAGQIHDSNSTMIEEYVRQSGGEISMFGRCTDSTSELHASLELGLANDLLCVTGGMSRGTHDLVPRMLEELKVDWLVSGAMVKPGRPLRIGRADTGCWVVGLPGNPLSCAACFLLFARPILYGLQGASIERPPHLAGILCDEIPANEDWDLYQPAWWNVGEEGVLQVSPARRRGSGDPFALATSNALLHRASGAPAARKGDSVHFIPLDIPR